MSGPVPVLAVDDLPPPPPGREGWPWTEGSPPARAAHRGEGVLPLIGLVTPSFNQAGFLEETLRSVLLQGYPALEYHVVDGGSTDGSVEIIRRYEPWLTGWVSEADEGQSHAINKGLRRCTGTIFNWLNSDDSLTPGALLEVGRLWAAHAPHVVLGAGRARTVGEPGTGESVLRPTPFRVPLDLLGGRPTVLCQPATFLSGEAVRALGGVSEDLHYAMDWELYLRLTLHLRGRLRVVETAAALAVVHFHPAAKTSTNWAGFREEGRAIRRSVRGRLGPWERLRAGRVGRGVALQDAVQAAAAGGAPLRGLAALALRRPEALSHRFFWGALRRTVSGER